MTITRVDAGWIVGHRAGLGHQLIEGGVLVYEGDTIVHVGESWEGRADEVIDARNSLVVPGLINTHTHMFTPVTRSYMEDLGHPTLGASTLLYTALPHVRASMRDDDLEASIAFSLVDVVKGGTTTVVVLHTANNNKTVPVAEIVADLCHSWGIRAYIAPMHASGNYYVKNDEVFYNWDEKRGHQALDEAIEFVENAERRYGGLVRGMLGPRQTALCKPDLLRRTAEAAEAMKVPVQVHTAEGMPEIRALREWYGRTPIQYLAENGMLRLGHRLTLSHCIHLCGHSTTPEPSDDLDLIRDSGVTVAHCPWVFGRRGTKLESYGRYRRHGIKISIGTDSSPQDMLSEMRWALIIGKLAESRNDAMMIRDVLYDATLGGALSLDRSDLGRLEAGAKADFVTVPMTGMRMSPVRDPLRNLLYFASSADVDRTVVGGRTLVEGGRATFVDEEKIAAQLQASADRVWGRMDDIETVSPFSIPRWTTKHEHG